MRTEVELVEGQPLPLLVSAVIPAGFRHGFTTRQGGVSPPPYHSLNFGRSWGDDPGRVRENRRRLGLRLHLADLHLVTQVHGAAAVRVQPGASPEALSGVQADVLVSDVPGAGLGVFTADCVPLLLADGRTGACAAVHAGWRGVVGGAATAALRALGEQFGSRPQDVAVAMGPAIGPCCFEVGPEVVAAFAAARSPSEMQGVVLAPPSGRRERPADRAHLDLRRALLLELLALGVRPDRIEATSACTRCDPAQRFYSYRRDNTRTGQHLAVIVRA